MTTYRTGVWIGSSDNRKLSPQQVKPTEGCWHRSICVRTGPQWCRAISAQLLWDWKERRATELVWSAFTISPTIKINFRGNMRREASLEITQVDHDIFKLLFKKLHFGSMNCSVVKLLQNAQVQEECDHVKTISEKTLLYADAHATSEYLWPLTTTWGSYWIELRTHKTACLKLAIGHMLYCRNHHLVPRMFTIRDHSILSINHWL